MYTVQKECGFSNLDMESPAKDKTSHAASVAVPTVLQCGIHLLAGGQMDVTFKFGSSFFKKKKKRKCACAFTAAGQFLNVVLTFSKV